jgi:hypothetical protein
MPGIHRKWVCNPEGCEWGPCYLSFGKACHPDTCPAFPALKADLVAWVDRPDGKAAKPSPKGKKSAKPKKAKATPKGSKAKKAKATPKGSGSSPKGRKKAAKKSPKGKPLGATKIQHPSPKVKPGWSVPRDANGKAKPYPPVSQPKAVNAVYRKDGLKASDYHDVGSKAKPSTTERFRQARQALLIEGPDEQEMEALAILRMAHSQESA